MAHVFSFCTTPSTAAPFQRWFFLPLLPWVERPHENDPNLDEAMARQIDINQSPSITPVASKPFDGGRRRLPEEGVCGFGLHTNENAKRGQASESKPKAPKSTTPRSECKSTTATGCVFSNETAFILACFLPTACF